jgi:outer membrane protein TolC
MMRKTLDLQYLAAEVWVVSGILTFCWAAMAHAELTLEETLQLALKTHPSNKVNQYLEEAAEKETQTARSAFYPQIMAMGLVTSGFPGSSAGLGVTGLMGSPYHKGPTAGFVLEQNIWDFGRTSQAVYLAEKESDLTKRQTQVSNLKIGQVAQEIYFDCARDRGLAEIYSRIAFESMLIQKEVENFVKIGQKSIVEKYLANSQTQQAVTFHEDFKRQFDINNQRLAQFLGVQANEEPLCPALTENWADQIEEHTNTSTHESSPWISLELAKTDVTATYQLLAEKDFNPKIVAMGSVGWLDKVEVGVPLNNYSVGIAVVWPLFEGFKTISKVQKYELLKISNEAQLEQTRFEIRDANISFESAIESAKVRISHYKKELPNTQKGFDIAKKRYFDLQGSLLDLRNTLSDLERTSKNLNLAIYDLMKQSTERALLNGQWNQLLEVKPKKDPNESRK